MQLVIRNYSSIIRLCSIPKSKPGDKIGVKGWVENIRRLKNSIFLNISDGSTPNKFQIVIPKKDASKTISSGSSLFAEGNIQLGPNGSYELHAENFEIIADGKISDGYPFPPKHQHAPEYVREHLHLRSRIDYIAAMMRLRHRTQKVLHDYMDELGFVQVNIPILTTNDCEGGGEVFTVRPESNKLLKEMTRDNIPHDQGFFDTKVYLTVSGQLHLECMSYGLGNTYSISPAFRAENSRSPLHLSEFYMFEAEIAFMEDILALVKFIEKTLKDITTRVLEADAENLGFCQKKAPSNILDFSWLNKPWETITYMNAIEIINNNMQASQNVVKFGDDLSKEQELFLVKYIGVPVFVIDWPKSLKPFYMKTSRDNVDLVQAVDLLMPTIGELCGGSLREHDVDILLQHPQFPKGMEWYLNIRKYGGIPTSGFGMGFERYLQLLSGVKNIRDVIPFPRSAHNCKM